jgi:hypothetical protein
LDPDEAGIMDDISRGSTPPDTRFPPVQRPPVPDSPFLSSVYQWQFPDGLDTPIRLPVYYYDNTLMSAAYTASTAMVKALLPSRDMHPVEILPGRCVVIFTAFEYRKTDIHPYNEFSIAFAVTFGRRSVPLWTIGRMAVARCFHAYVWQLPVTTEIARWGGVDLYGYPKFVADIDFAREDTALVCRVGEGGAHILTLRGAKLATTPGKRLRFKTYSLKDGIPLCANIYANPIQYAETVRTRGVSLELGEDHAIARQLRLLGLSKRPLFYQYSPNNELILFAPRNLIDD